MLDRIRDNARAATLLADVFDFDVTRLDPVEPVRLASGGELHAAAGDASGGTFFLCDNGPVLYAGSEGTAGILAADLSAAIRLIIGVPTWQDVAPLRAETRRGAGTRPGPPRRAADVAERLPHRTVTRLRAAQRRRRRVRPSVTLRDSAAQGAARLPVAPADHPVAVAVVDGRLACRARLVMWLARAGASRRRGGASRRTV